MPSHPKDYPRPWRDEETLRKLYEEDGLTLPEIADELGCSDGTISNWFSKFGIDTSDHRKSDGAYTEKEVMRELFTERRLSRDEIADRFGIHRHTVNVWLRKHGLQEGARSLKYGRLCVTSGGYVQFVDYRGTNDDTRIYLHRLLALVDHDIEDLDGKDVHHKIPIPWLNYRENIEVLTPQEHRQRHC